jgi:hypothetical protein
MGLTPGLPVAGASSPDPRCSHFSRSPPDSQSKNRGFLRPPAWLLGWLSLIEVPPRRYRVASPAKQARLHRQLKDRVRQTLAGTPGWS